MDIDRPLIALVGRPPDAIEELAAAIPADQMLIGPLNRTDVQRVGTALFGARG